jgi:hypothetical protein
MKKIILAGFCLALNSFFAQQSQIRTCGTQTPPQQFEVWVNSLMNQLNSGPRGSSANIQSVFNIPVIVHIIHNNEAVNSTNATTGNNLNAAQVINQINILNADFKGLNADTSLIPTVFKPVLGKFQVNFCLAVVNPTGGVLAEPGIDRINRVARGWNSLPYSQTYIDATVKPNSIWDPNRYLNIWVCPLSNSLLGYATFPNPGATGLPGLSAPFGSTITDGVVILNTAFGSIGTGAGGVYNLGRTATHEVGHWMGLRHIWGDGTCASDFCNDTPPAQTSNFNCPTFPYKLGTCAGNTTGEMTMNFMDYTNDACMYMFTKDQKFRAQLILANSALRSSLITSTACNLPTAGTDAGISSVARPTFSQTINCNNFIDPLLNITNYGTTTLTNLVVTYQVDNVNPQTFTWTGTANPNSTFTLAVPQIAGLSNGAHFFSATLSLPNGTVDVNPNNNSNLQNFIIANQLTVTVNSPSTCAGSTVNLTASGATSYNWGSNGTGATITVTPSVTSVYSFTAGNTSCNVVRTTTVTVLAGPSVTVNSASACTGATVSLTANGANSYTWSTGAQSSAITVSANSTAIYTVTGNNGGFCSSVRQATLSILPSPSLSVNNATVCSGVSASLSASGATSYTWSTGSNANAIVVSPLSSTVYVLSGQVGNCITTRNVNVTIGGGLSLFISPSQSTICAGSTVILNASGANTYSWSTSAVGASIAVSPSVTSTYSLAGLASTCSGTGAITIQVNALPITIISATNSSCFGSNNGQINAASNGNGPFTYTYSAGTSNLSAGIYSVITKDNKGCLKTNTISISQPSAISASGSGSITTCPFACDATGQIVVSGGTAPYTSTIFPGGLVGQNFTNLCAANYTFYLSDAKGCPGFGTFSVAAGDAGIQVSTSNNNLSCSSCSDGSIVASGSGGTAPYSYTWTPGNFYSSSIVDMPAGCYTLNVRDANGCSAEKQICLSFDTGLNESAPWTGLRVSPNPSSGLFLISGLSMQTQVYVYDARGRLISAMKKDLTAEIDLSENADGIYFVRMISNEHYGVLQLIKH